MNTDDNPRYEPYKGNPYRPQKHKDPPSRSLFMYRHKEMDPIQEAIKFVGYLGAGIHAESVRPAVDHNCFARRAALTIEDYIIKNRKYDLKLHDIFGDVDEFIEYTLNKYHDLEHIKKISDVNNAKMSAHQAIAVFVPVLLKQFCEKGLI